MRLIPVNISNGGFLRVRILEMATNKKDAPGWKRPVKSGGGGGIRRVAFGNARRASRLAALRPGTCMWHVPPLRVRIPHHGSDGFANKNAPLLGALYSLAEEEGFEPS